MNIRFWGVHGSIPAPLTPARVKSKISAIVQQITNDDIVSAESRERFLAGLPPWLFGTVGGNSPCVTVDFDDEKDYLVFDCGSGLREFGMAQTNKDAHYHIFLSHFHWDHLQGLPFFGPGFNPQTKVDFYSPFPNIEKIISGQMVQPYFPVSFEAFASKKSYHQLTEETNICGRTVSFKKMNHPGGSYSYCVNENGKRIIYATDIELTSNDFLETEENSSFFRDADLIIIDCQYTLGEAIEKYNWGHNAFSLAVDFVVNWGIKHMVMFHHDPAYDDHKLYGLLQSARWYLDRLNIKEIELTLAYEGLSISV